MDYSVYRIALEPPQEGFCCSAVVVSRACGTGHVAEDERNGLKQQEAQLLSWDRENVKNSGCVTI